MRTYIDKWPDEFPSLIEVNLEYNDFTVFDFGDLPEEIKSVALRGNDGITSYVNLMSADGTTALCRSLTYLKLPYFAKWNTDAFLHSTKLCQINVW